MEYYKDKMKELDADGIDFMPIYFNSDTLPPIIESYTKEEFENVIYIPKTNYRYWKLEDGKKKYIT